MISAAARSYAGPTDTWREHPLAVCGRYVATESFCGFPHSDFEAGDTYVLEHVEYSRDDLSTIFTFHKRGSIVPVYWWWYDDEPGSLCRDRFRRLV